MKPQPLKGNSPHVQAEQTRNMKQQGLDEKSIAMVHMKASKARSKAEVKPMAVDKEDYPYGLRIDLGTDEMDKLGMTMPNVGDKVKLRAKAHVHSTSQDQYSGGKPSKRVSLQITHLKVK